MSRLKIFPSLTAPHQPSKLELNLRRGSANNSEQCVKRWIVIEDHKLVAKIRELDQRHVYHKKFTNNKLLLKQLLIFFIYIYWNSDNFIYKLSDHFVSFIGEEPNQENYSLPNQISISLVSKYSVHKSDIQLMTYFKAEYMYINYIYGFLFIFVIFFN